MQRAFLLLGLSATTLFAAVQFSVPLSLGLFGVFSIIRFRNPVRDPEEIGFLMLLLASAVLCAISQFLFLGVFLLFATGALVARAAYGKQSRPVGGLCMVSLDLPEGANHLERIEQVLKAELPNSSLETLSFREGLLTAECRFIGDERPDTKRLSDAFRPLGEIKDINIIFTRGAPRI